MNRQIRRLGIGLLVCFTALFVRLNQLQVFGAEALETHPINTRSIIEDFGQSRGDIITADGVVVATSIEVEGQIERARQYPTGELHAHVTGWYAFNLGASGVERTYNDQLAGNENPVPVTRILDLLGPGDRSADVHLTIRDDVQRAAREALGDRRGSVVAIDPSSGAVQAMWSWPSYDPNLLSTLDFDAAQTAWTNFTSDAENPLLARSYREIYAPGSTFKVVTAASGLASGRIGPTSPVFDNVPDYVAPLTDRPLANFGGAPCGGNLAQVLARSCNTSFAQLGAELLGPELMIGTAEGFGFNSTPPIDLPAGVASRFPTDFGAELGVSDLDPRVPLVENTPALAQSSIGQFEVAATPLQMALVAGAVANGGEILAPHTVAEVIADDGELVQRAEPTQWQRAMRPEVAATLRELMVGVVTGGTAQSLLIDGLEVGAKTGTAQTITDGPTDDTHAWIIAFAGPPGQPATAAVAVIVEAVPGAGQQTGGSVAAPVALEVLQTMFR